MTIKIDTLAQPTEPIVFQPAVAGGAVFVSTGVGSLIGLNTGDASDTLRK